MLYLEVLKALYGMLQSSLLWYKKLRQDLESQGFVINPYDPCVANKMVRGKQMTVVWHVDDLKISHVLQEAVDSFVDWVKKKYGSIGTVKTTIGKRHPYVGFTLDYSVPGEVTIDMVDYVENMLKTYSEPIKGSTDTLASEKLFTVDKNSPLLGPELKEEFHTVVAQGLFLCQRSRHDIERRE